MHGASDVHGGWKKQTTAQSSAASRRRRKGDLTGGSHHDVSCSAYKLAITQIGMQNKVANASESAVESRRQNIPIRLVGLQAASDAFDGMAEWSKALR